MSQSEANLQFTRVARSVRQRILDAVYAGKKGHLGGAFSCADILLYLFRSQLVESSTADRKSSRPLILSKGHSATALLAVIDELGGGASSLLSTYNQENSLIGNNPSEFVPGVEFHTGSLGHGVGLGCGVALAAQLSGSAQGGYVVVMISDGELLEGSTWEGLLFAVANKLNVCVIVDRNQQICEGYMRDCVDVPNLAEAMRSIGLEVLEVDGHEYSSLAQLDQFISVLTVPRLVVAETIKGKGVSFMEGVIRWHHSIPDSNQYLAACKELSS